MSNKMKNKLTDTALAKHKRESSYRLMESIDSILSMLMIILAVFSLRLFVFEPIRVEGSSMEPTLHNEERMFVEKVSYWFHTPNRGDIVICYYPNRGDYTFVKRVIGLPGETLEVSEGKVYINGTQLDEAGYWEGYINGHYGPVVIPEDCVFVMGDNRNGSGDSRAGEVGPIPIYRIVGRVHGVVWPFSGMREV